MIKLHLKQKFLEWKPNISSIAEQIILGPQRDVLEKLDEFNRRYDLSLKITKTYRWSPGYMLQIHEWMTKRYLELQKKRKIDTFFNQIDGKSWHFGNFKDKLRQIENTLSSMRRSNARFQDNTDICVTLFDKLKERIQQETEGLEEYINVYLGQSIADNDELPPINKIVLEFKLPKTHMSLFIGEQSYPIPIDSVHMYYSFDFEELLYRMAYNTDWVNDDSLPVMTTNRQHYSYNGRRYGLDNTWKAAYNRSYINERADEPTFNTPLQLLHPFISSEEYSYSNTSVVDEELTTRRVAYACTGDYTTILGNLIRRLKLGEIYSVLYNWHTVYNAVGTSPMNRPPNMWFGKHKFMDETFSNTYDVNQNQCRLSSSPLNDTKYCDDYKCEYRSICNHYIVKNGGDMIPVEDGGELSDQDGEVRRDPQGREIINQEALTEHIADMTAEGEMVREDPNQVFRDQLDNHGGIEDPNEDAITIEEQMIIWASQRGGAINIANERNENG